jgi:hypothetical protein
VQLTYRVSSQADSKSCHLQANELLASFDVRLREYATNHLIAVCWWSCSLTLA